MAEGEEKETQETETTETETQETETQETKADNGNDAVTKAAESLTAATTGLTKLVSELPNTISAMLKAGQEKTSETTTEPPVKKTTTAKKTAESPPASQEKKPWIYNWWHGIKE